MQQVHHDTIDQQGDLSAVVALFRYGQGTYPQLGLGVALVVLSSGLLMGSAKLMGLLAEQLLQKQGLLLLAQTAAGILLLEGIHIIVYYKGRVSLAYATNLVALQIRKALFAKLARLPMHYYDLQPLGRTITRLTADVEGIESFFSNTLPRVLTAIITVISVMVAMLLTDLTIGFFIVLSSLPALLFTIVMRRPVRYWLQVNKRKSAAINAKLAEFISGLSVIKAFGLESWSERAFHSASLDLLDSSFKLMNWNTFIRPIAAFLCSLPIVVILLWGGHLTLEGALSIGLLVAFIRYAERFFRPIMQLSFELHVIQEAIASSERVRKLLDEPEEQEHIGNNGTIRQAVQGKVAYQAVSMRYQSGPLILKDISFEVKAGMSVGLVGRTGSGKSTTVHLIPQLYPTCAGEILIDDIPLRNWDRQALREQIGIVSQDVVIFRGSLRENLLITCDRRHERSDEQLWQACERSGLSRVLAKLPQGLDTLLQDGASNLSMGERQLVAFTRMLLRNPAILILDEATAHVDEQCELLIQQAILEVLQGRTCFIIAHRLSTIKHCDHILVFDAGRIVEQGRHQDLLDRQGLYARLVERQLED